MSTAATTAAVTPEEAARQLMNYGETAYRKLFPEPQPTLSFGPFRYRAYSTGILLGVVVAADPNYVLGGVYVMGGTYGSVPLYVGQLTSFITPVPPGPGPVGSNNGCYNLDLMGSSGTVISITYDHNGPVTGSTTVQSAVNSNILFEGQLALETLVKTTGTLFQGGLPTKADAEVKNYHRKTGDAELTFYGSATANTVTTNDYIAATNEKTVYTPAFVDRRYALGFNEALTSSWTSTTTRVTTYSNSLPTATNTFNNSSTETIQYLGRETLTVPAGDYATCKFERVNSTTGTVTQDWVLAGKGMLLKSVKRSIGGGAAEQTMEARSVLLNLEPL